MAAQDPFTPPNPTEWLPPAGLPSGESFGAGVGRDSPPPMFELRPLTTSEVLDRTFAVYRSRFWLFAGIASFTSVLQTLVSASQMLLQTRSLSQLHRVQTGRPLLLPAGTGQVIVLTVIASMILFVASSVVMAACVFAMGETYLGRGTTIKEAFQATLRRWYSYIGIAFWQFGSIVWLPLALAVPGGALLALGFTRGAVFSAIGGFLLVLGFTVGAVVGGYFGLRNVFAIPITVLEQMDVRPAMRRSKMLTVGVKWKLMLMGLITWALLMVVGILQAPLAFLTAMLLIKGGHAYITQGLTLLINFVGYSVVTPVFLIGNTLLYFDQRVRKEAFDIAFLLGEEQVLKTEAYAATSAQVGPMQAVDATLP